MAPTALAAVLARRSSSRQSNSSNLSTTVLVGDAPVSCVHAGSERRANGRKAASPRSACCSYVVRSRRDALTALLLLTAAELPGASAQAVQVTSPCSLTDGGSCATSPNYPNSYGINEECTISGVPPVELETVAFEVEGDAYSYLDYDGNGDPTDDCYKDYLTVNGKRYCGTSGPSGAVAEDGVVEWRSDSVEVKSGWKARPWSLSLPFFLLSDALLPLSSDLLGDPAAFTANGAAFTAFAASIASTAIIAPASSAAAGLPRLCRRGDRG